jgi:tetratricopeptide (TPR) repeat protein
MFNSGDDTGVISAVRLILPDLSGDEKRFKALLLMACSEWRKGWAKQSLQTLGKAAELFDEVSPRLKGRFHGQRAIVHSRLKNPDAALVDLEAAKFWAEEAADDEEIAIARNNLSKQYSDAGRFDEAIVEVEAAIDFARCSGNPILLGQFCDMKAQILVKAERFEEAMEFSERAMTLLESHPAHAEARETHGRALIGLGTTYLTQDDPVSTFRARRQAAGLVSDTLTDDLIRLALKQSNGNILNAASRLGVYHFALQKAMRSYGIPHKARARSLVTK